MSDLVTRLLHSANEVYGTHPCGLMSEAAARITELEAALQHIIKTLEDPTGGQHVSDMRFASSVARAALEGKKDE